jgi:hypothetical protein
MPWTSHLTTAVVSLGDVAMAAIYAAHLSFAEDVKIIEEHSTREYRGLASTSTPLQLFVSAHVHASVALAVAAASPYYMGMVFIFGLTAPLSFRPQSSRRLPPSRDIPFSHCWWGPRFNYLSTTFYWQWGGGIL